MIATQRMTWPLCMLLAAGCGDDSTKGGESAAPPAKATQSGAGDDATPAPEEIEVEDAPLPIGVSVLEPGKPAQAPLARATETGVARPLRVVFSAIEITPKNKRPLLFPTVHIDGTHVRTDGSKGTLQISSVQVGPGPGVSEEAATAVAAEVRTGPAAYELGEWGEVTSLAWPPSAAAPGTATLAAVARHALSHLSIPVPAETIGRGGRWAVKRSLELFGLRVVQTIRVKLTKVYGAQIEVEGKVSYELDPESPTGGVLDLEKVTALVGDGSFFARLHLPSGTPIEMRLKATLRPKQDNKQRMIRIDARVNENFLAAGDSRVTFNGKFTQGGLVRGVVAPKTKVWLNREEVMVSKEGDFLLAFGRNADERAKLGFQFPGGEIERHIVFVEQREFEPEKIDGLPPEMVDYDKETKSALAKSRKRITKLRNKRSKQTFFKEGWRWPLKGRITSTYGRKRILNGKEKGIHWGVDVAAGVGKKVRAPAPGVVVFAESDVPLSGTLLIIDHGHGLTSSFLHLKKVTVKVGDTVKLGQVVAKSGNSGRSTGPHLDWRMNLGETRVDPQLLVGGS